MIDKKTAFIEEVEHLVDKIAEGNKSVMLAFEVEESKNVVVLVRNIGQDSPIENVSLFRTLFISINEAADGFIKAVAEKREPSEEDKKILSLYKATKDIVERFPFIAHEIFGGEDERTIH